MYLYALNDNMGVIRKVQSLNVMGRIIEIGAKRPIFGISLELPPLSICVSICFEVRLLLFQSHGISWDEYCASCLRSL